MAFVVDFMNCLFSDKQEKKAMASPEFQEWKELQKQCEVMLSRNYFGSTNRQGDLSKPEKLILMKERRLIDAIWKQYQHIPEQMTTSVLEERVGSYMSDMTSILHWFANTPRVKLAEIREAAAKLSYMILPIDYVDTAAIKSIEDELFGYYWSGRILRALSSAKSDLSSVAGFIKHDLYVFCPISFYDLCQAEKGKKQREVIFGGELMQMKATLDTIMRIQRNLFAILGGNEADTDVWEIGEGGQCSQNELMHLRLLVETIMPIQKSLLDLVRNSVDMKAWGEKMRSGHYAEVSRILRETSQGLSWVKEAIKAKSLQRYDDVEKQIAASMPVHCNKKEQPHCKM